MLKNFNYHCYLIHLDSQLVSLYFLVTYRVFIFLFFSFYLAFISSEEPSVLYFFSIEFICYQAHIPIDTVASSKSLEYFEKLMAMGKNLK